MGIHNLAKVIGDFAPAAIKENEMKHYFGRKIAIDASMSIYQFLIAIRQDGNQLTSENGETTSHLNGLFYRTIRLIESGMKPVYVFDGKPPQMKGDELAKRHEKREDAQKQLATATEAGDTEAIDKFSRRLVKVTKTHNDECKKLLKLMGIPYIEAPCEAESQCAHMVKQGTVYATATEDMDALTFGSKILLRYLTASEAKKLPVKEFHLDKVLSEFDMKHEEFIDLCILLGCDYCDGIRGIGQKRAFELIKQHRTIDNVLKNLDTSKYPPPEDWKYKESRDLFINPEVTDVGEDDLKWLEPDEEKLIEFMVTEKNFGEERMRNGVKKLMKGRHGSTQGRIDSFFTVKSVTLTSIKRKSTEDKKGPAKKKPFKGGKKK